MLSLVILSVQRDAGSVELCMPLHELCLLASGHEKRLTARHVAWESRDFLCSSQTSRSVVWSDKDDGEKGQCSVQV